MELVKKMLDAGDIAGAKARVNSLISGTDINSPQDYQAKNGTDLVGIDNANQVPSESPETADLTKQQIFDKRLNAVLAKNKDAKPAKPQ